MKVLIYGGGSVGLGIASCLLKSVAQVDIVAREDTVRLLRSEGLVRRGIMGEYFAEPGMFGSYLSVGEIQSPDYDYILVCTKSFDSLASAKDIFEHRHILADRTKIVLFQNGWGNAEKFLSFFDKERICNARVITGFGRDKKNEVTITVHADAIHIGSLFGGDLSSVSRLCWHIDDGGIPCRTTDSIEKDLWAKMLYNCALNALGAILEVPYGVLAEYESSRRIMREIAEEVFAVMGCAGYQTHWYSAEQFLSVFYEKLVPDTAEHKSSTLQDIMAKKKTEIDALNGAVIKLADDYDTEVPYNRAVYNIVKFIEARAKAGDRDS